METEWDKSKETINIKKHGLSFEVAKEIFDDPFHVSILDERFSYFEERWITLGQTLSGKVIVVGHLYGFRENGEEVIRIVSARKATRKEQVQYERL